nr:hypothetical protein [Tanacetum cinerariifolium]
MENVLQENDRLLTQALSVEIVNIVVHDNMKFDFLNVDGCAHYVTTESELKPDFIKKECYETLLQQYNILETHCISLEVNNQLAITEGTWGFEHTKACFRDDIIQFVKNLKDLFTSFYQCLIDEVTEFQKIFKQMEMAVEQHCAEKTAFQTKIENVLKENDRLLTHALGVEIMNIVVNDY